MPASVNDCGRMMMGALRREHDRITAQIGSVAGTINTTNITAVTVNTTGAITASGPITGTALNSSGNGSIAGTLTAGGVSTGNLNASGTVTAATLTSTGNINASGSLAASGNITAGGQVAGAYIHSSGNIDAVGQIGANTMVANHIQSNGSISAAASVTCTDVHAEAGHVYCNLVFPNGDNQGGVGNIGQAYQSMFSYNYVTASDARVKTNIEPLPPGCLDLVGAIEPQMYHIVGEDGTQARHWGFIAQEVGAAMQAAGREFAGHRVDAKSGAEGLAYNEMIALLFGAVRELTQQVATLRKEKADV